MQKTPVDYNQPRTPPCIDAPEGYGTPGGDGGWHHPSPEPLRVPCKFPPRHCHCPSSSRCPANPFQTDERTSWKPKVGRRRRCDPLPATSCPHPGAKTACGPTAKGAPGDQRMLLGMGERRMFIFGTRGWQQRLDGSSRTPGAGHRATPPVLRVPPSPRPCPWGAQRFLLVNRMFFSSHPPTTLACSLASVSWYGRLRGTQGGR